MKPNIRIKHPKTWAYREILLASKEGRPANLRNAILDGANLREAYLAGSDLAGVDFTNAYLGGADLSNANLKFANLTNANLCGTDLTNVDLTSANLGGANLTNADIKFADLVDATFADADLTRVDLEGSDLRGTNLSGTKGLQAASDWMNKNFNSTEEGYIVYKRVGAHTPFSIPDNWVIQEGSTIGEVCNANRTSMCACGVNFGTEEWCLSHLPELCLWECLIKWEWAADITVPYNVNGTARCGKLQLIRCIKNKVSYDY